MIKFEDSNKIKYSFNFQFTHPKDLVYKILTNYAYIYVFAPTLKIKQFLHLQKESSDIFQKSSKYTIDFQSKIVIIEVIDIINTDYFSQIIWKISIPSLIHIPSYLASFNLHYISSDQTLFVTNYSYQTSNIQKKNFPVGLFFGNHHERVFFYQMINNFITEKKYLTMQIEILSIPGDLQFCYKILTNVKVMSEIIGEPISNTNNIINVGVQFSIKILYAKKPLFFGKMIIKIKDIIIYPDSFELISTITEPDIDFPTRTNNLKIDYDANYGLSFTSTDKFINPLTEEQINRISLAKKKVFAKLYKLIEVHENKKHI